MKPITVPGIEEYARWHSSPDPELLLDVVDATRDHFEAYEMMIGPLGARFLQMLLYALRPQNVLEIGTFTGYSAISMAAALPPGGHIVTCEIDPRHAAIARRHIDASPYADRITIELGPALQTIARLEGPFDFVFLDADKVSYLHYLEAVLPKLGEHALIAADNTLWNGDVLDRPPGDADTDAIRWFNETVGRDPRLVCVLLTVRDGITLIRPAGA
jgi:caffeoyl-CoA O-methyltransferase